MFLSTFYPSSGPVYICRISMRVAKLACVAIRTTGSDDFANSGAVSATGSVIPQWNAPETRPVEIEEKTDSLLWV